MLNCKKGDLAVIVNSAAGNEGKIVRCLDYIGLCEWDHIDGVRLNETWRIDQKLPPFDGFDDDTIEDHRLRPLRDSEGEDEVLRLVGKPMDSLVGA